MYQSIALPSNNDILFTQSYLLTLLHFFLKEFALNSILIDERLGFTPKFFGKAMRYAIIPPSCPTLEYVLTTNGYDVCFLST